MLIFCNLLKEFTYKIIGNTIIIEGGHRFERNQIKKCDEILSLSYSTEI